MAKCNLRKPAVAGVRCVCTLSVLLCAIPALAQTPADGVIDSLGRGFDTLGDALARLLRSATAEEAASSDAPFHATRRIDRHFPASTNTTLYLAHRFGPVVVRGWDEPVVRVEALIQAEANTTAQARTLAEALAIETAQEDNRLRVETRLPESPPADEHMLLTAQYQVRIPHDAAAVVKNRFGDTHVAEVHGNVTVDAAYGEVTLTGLAPPAGAGGKRNGRLVLRARACPAVTVTKPNMPARLELTDSHTTLAPGAAPVDVMAMGGLLTLDGPPEASAPVTIRSENTHLTLTGVQNMPVQAHLLHTRIDGLPPAKLRRFGPLHILEAQEDPPAIVLDQAFGVVTFAPAAQPRTTTPEDAAAPSAAREEDAALYTTETWHTRPAGDAQQFVVAVRGATVNLHADPATDTVRAEVAHALWAGDAEAAEARFQALSLDLTRENADVHLTYAPDAAGFQRETVLDVHYPAALALEVVPPGGEPGMLDLRVADAEAPVNVTGISGTVALRNSTGPSVVRLRDGAIAAADTAGALELTNAAGGIDIRGHTGPLTATTVGGDLTVWNHQGPATYHVETGDVLCTVTKRWADDFLCTVADGDFTMILPEDAALDADLSIVAVGGTVRSAVPLTGAIEGDRYSFHAVLGAGVPRARIEVTEGDIVLRQAGGAKGR
ncbi:MAG: hypothetical protein ACLFTT_08115 [Candidatus Hydrogenedentota bacterium]